MLAGTPLVFEKEVTFKFAGRRHVQCHYVPEFAPDGSVRGFYALTIDISERKEAEKALRESQERIRAITDAVPVLIAYVDRDLRYGFVNESYSGTFGKPREEILGKTVPEMLGPEAFRIIKPNIDRVFAGHPASGRVPLSVPGKGPREFRTQYTPHFGEGGEVLGFYACISDITDSVALEEQLRQSQKMEAIGQLAGGVAHDFNNILQIVTGNVLLAKTDPAGAAKYLDEVERAAAAASDLTRQLLAFGRRQVLRTEVLEMNDLVANVMKMVRRLIGENIELVLVPSALRAVEADPGMMEQVLVNLVVNARHAMPEGGRLVIETRDCVLDETFARENEWAAAGQYVLITVSDTGCGMTAEVRARIFDPFFTTKAAGEGTGLGLSTVYGILKQHNGMVDVDSEPGEGTVFKVYLPVTEKPVSPEGAPAPQKVPGGNETILVAEDDPNVLVLVTRLLESRGYGVVVARDGEEAAGIFAEKMEEIGLVIMDVVMPKMSGPSLFKKIRAMHKTVPILVSTGYAANTLDSNFLSSNGLRMIQKPFAPTELFLSVRQAIDGPPLPAGEALTR